MTIEFERWKLVLAVIAGVLTTVGSVLAPLFQVFPGLKPDAPATNLRAKVTAVGLDKNAPAHDFSRPGLVACGNPTPRARGVVVYVETEIEGFKKKTTALRCSLYRESDRTRLSAEEIPVVPVVEITPEAPTDRAILQVWIPVRRTPTRYFARFELYDQNPGGDDVLIGVASSESFSGSSAGEPPQRK